MNQPAGKGPDISGPRIWYNVQVTLSAGGQERGLRYGDGRRENGFGPNGSGWRGGACCGLVKEDEGKHKQGSVFAVMIEL